MAAQPAARISRLLLPLGDHEPGSPLQGLTASSMAAILVRGTSCGFLTLGPGVGERGSLVGGPQPLSPSLTGHSHTGGDVLPCHTEYSHSL